MKNEHARIAFAIHHGTCFHKINQSGPAMNLHNILVFNGLSCEQLEAICNILSLNVEYSSCWISAWKELSCSP